MKANLALFVDELASELGLQNWDLEPNPEANGGRVIIVEGDLASDTELYKQLSTEAAELGNYPIDLLACVPPSMVNHGETQANSVPGHTLIAAGIEVWDASDIDVREYFPTDRNAIRILQYDSCRGLEGWTVINFGFDEFWDYKFNQGMEAPPSMDDEMASPEEVATTFASRWAMIPLTRAMDTLVINVSTRSSQIKTALAQVCERRGDFTQWITK